MPENFKGNPGVASACQAISSRHTVAQSCVAKAGDSAAIGIAHQAPTEAFGHGHTVGPHVVIAKEREEVLQPIEHSRHHRHIKLAIVAAADDRNGQLLAVGQAVDGEDRKTDEGEPWSQLSHHETRNTASGTVARDARVMVGPHIWAAVTRHEQESTALVERRYDIILPGETSVGGEQYIFLEILWHVIQGTAASLQHMVAYSPFTLVIHLGVVPPVFEHHFAVAVFNPDVDVGDVAIGLWVVGLAADGENAVLVAYVGPVVEEIEVCLVLARRIVIICFAQDVAFGNGNDFGDGRRRISVLQGRLEMVVMVE